MIRTVVHFVDSAEFGGTEQAVLHLLAGLDRQRWRPVLFHHAEPGIRPLLKSAERLNLPLREVPRMRGKQSLITRLPQFIRQLRAERPAIFHAHLNSPLACKDGFFAAALARVPVVVATAQLFVELSLSRFMYAQQRFVATVVDRYIAVSHEVAARLHQAFRIPARKIDVVHNGISLTPFNRPAHGTLRAALLGGREQPIVLTAARLAEQKGHCYLLEAATLVPEATFVLAGDGPGRANLEAQARELGLSNRVLFLGYRPDIPNLLASCDVFVLPSLFEGLPLAVLEAMAAGKPVIASAIGGTDEAIIHGETGLLVPAADPTALAMAIRTVLFDPVLAQRLAVTGKSRAYQKFSAETMAQRVAQIYEELLSSHEALHGHR